MFELESPAKPAMLAELRRSLNRWLEAVAVDREVAFEITVAVNEACSNAIAHAYGPAPGTFHVQLERVDGRILASVCDHGRWRTPRREGRGRGLKMMRAAMDSVEVRTGRAGTKVLMRRAVRPRASSA